jgi:metallo-beta-lactamase family protein
LVGIDDSKILLDCGLYQGHRHDALTKTRTFPVPPETITAVLLSHAHIDHSGGLPLLVKRGFSGPIHCTEPTADLLRIMLMDSAILQEEDAKFFNKLHAAEGLSIEPLYTREDAEKALGLLVPHAYEDVFPVAPFAESTFHNAGHVLGSAMVRLSLRLQKRVRHILFTGDLGRHESLLMVPPKIPPHVDYLLIESTYGGRRHPPLVEAGDVLADVITRSEKEGGPILIPSFALERTQELVYLLERLRRSGRIQPIRIYVDSPMAVDITAIFQKYASAWEAPSEFRPEVAREGDPFGLKTVRYVKSVEESKRLMGAAGRRIIMAGSGMCEGGRILHHLRNLIDRTNTTVLLVGHQVSGTLGRRLLDGAKKVKIFGLSHDVAAEIRQLTHLSSHADTEDLAAFVRGLSPRPVRVFLVHGDADQRQALTERLKVDAIDRVESPRAGDEFTLD